MAFVTGSAANQTELLTALRSACTANGYTLTGEVLHKGNVFVRTFNSATAGEDSAFNVMMGTGQSGGTLSGAFQYGVNPNRATVFRCSYPVTYDIHIHGDEVFMVWWDASERYFWIAFGQSNPYNATPAAGSALWCGGTASTAYTINSGTYYTPNRWICMSATEGGTSTGVTLETQQCCAPALFWHTRNPTVRGFSNTIYTDIDGNALGGRGTVTDSTDDYVVTGIRQLAPLLARQPNAWNGESLLLPIQCYTPAASSKHELDISVRHARYFRLNNVDPRTVLTIGAEKWKVYPWYKLDRANPNSSNDTASMNAVNHTGTFGWAVRYDGP